MAETHRNQEVEKSRHYINAGLLRESADIHEERKLGGWERAAKACRELADELQECADNDLSGCYLCKLNNGP